MRGKRTLINTDPERSTGYQLMTRAKLSAASKLLEATPGVLMPNALDASISCQVCRNKIVSDKERAKRQAEWQAQARERENQRIEESERWHAWYDQYLQSPEWANNRRAALDRENSLCQGCRKRGATYVRHLTFEHVGHEMLWELVAVCASCHEQLQQLKDADRAQYDRIEPVQQLQKDDLAF